MYTEDSETTGHHQFFNYNNSSSLCPCRHCIYYDQLHGYQQKAWARKKDHSFLGRWREPQAPWVKDVGGSTFLVDRVERSGNFSPQRRPVFAGPGPCSQSDDLSQASPWEMNPAQWGDPAEPRVRQYSFVKEQCGCVADSERARPFHSGIPHPLPHLQVKGQGYSLRRAVRYITVDEEESFGCAPNGYHLDLHHPQPVHSHMTNGHCGPRRVVFEGEEERDGYLDQGRPKGGSEDYFNDCSESDKGFFPTEVPQKHWTQRRHKGSDRGSDIASSEISKTTTKNDLHSNGSDVSRQRGRQESVRDQIRQVVTDLEEVLGGLKQVHVEMKEVVEQIDRLTANIDLSEEESCSALGSSNNLQESAPSGDYRLAPLPLHKPAMVGVSLQNADEDRVVCRTNPVSPVHMASVVKTSHFTPTGLHKHGSHKKPSANGHPPNLYHTGNSKPNGQICPEPQPHTLDPTVIIANNTSSARTQKPPPYPQNGRCGKGPYPPIKPLRAPTHPARGRQSTSMV
ncbi:uncharacterized protein si:ch211-178n15.1 [Cyprinodon tularosa]|uniref:uncharacterized protein si:ch211-178n15.1 n=1 Tax=Cyprinodon tularosa TaxID=77115 RepID=UPI0018E28933|nr:uncharacterized protein si:ch211-178n15.1 [Cyprinodon tularosa]